MIFENNEDDFRRRLRAFAVKELLPYAHIWDETEAFPERTWQAIKDAGLIGLTMPVEFGGQGAGLQNACLAIEEVAWGCTATAMALQFNLNGPAHAIDKVGSPHLRQKYIPGAVDGNRYFAVAMTEPSAGSAGTELVSEFTKTADGYILNGVKCYITGALRADTFLVFGRLAGTTGADGIGAAVIEANAPGFAPPIGEAKMGGRGVSEGTLTFENVVIAEEDFLVIPEKGSRAGVQLMMRQFHPERCGNAAMCLGIAQRALDESRSYSLERRQFGRRIAEFQGIQWMLADMAMDIEASRLLLYAAAGSTEDDGFPSLRATVLAKLYANEMVQRVTNKAIQIHGHAGYARDRGIERLFRDGRGMAIGGGTTEILRNMLAAEVLGERFSQRA